MPFRCESKDLVDAGHEEDETEDESSEEKRPGASRLCLRVGRQARFAAWAGGYCPNGRREIAARVRIEL